MKMLDRCSLPLLGLTACALLLACHIAWIGEPWDTSYAGDVSGAFYGRTFQVWDAHGALDCRFSPTRFASRHFTEPYPPYLTHPPTPYLVAYPSWLLFGRSEAAARLPSLACLLLTMLFLHRAVRRHGTRESAWTSLAVFGSLPILFAHGNTVDAPVYSMALLTPGLAAWFRWRSGDGRYTTFFVLAMLAGLVDWFGYFLVPAIWLDLLLSRAPLRSLPRSAFLAGLPFGAGLLVVFAWMAWASAGHGGLRLIGDYLATTNAADDNWLGDSLLPNLRGMASLTFRGLGVLPILLVAGGLTWIAVAVARGRPTPDTRFALGLLVAGFLPSIVFLERAGVHEFWSLTAAPGFAAVATVFLGRLSRVSASWLRPALIVAVIVTGAFSGTDLHARYRRTDAEGLERARLLNEHTGIEDVVLFPGWHAADSYYVEAMMVSRVRDAAAFRFALRWLAPAKSSMRRLYLLWDSPDREASAWLADLPITGVTVMRYSGIEALLLELDRERAFAMLD